MLLSPCPQPVTAASVMNDSAVGPSKRTGGHETNHSCQALIFPWESHLHPPHPSLGTRLPLYPPQHTPKTTTSPLDACERCREAGSVDIQEHTSRHAAEQPTHKRLLVPERWLPSQTRVLEKTAKRNAWSHTSLYTPKKSLLTIYFKYRNGTQRIVMIDRTGCHHGGTRESRGKRKRPRDGQSKGYKSQEKRNMVSSRASGTASCRGP